MLREWIQAQIAASDKAQISVLYASAYGNTAALAQGISRGITKAGMYSLSLTFIKASALTLLHDTPIDQHLGLSVHDMVPHLQLDVCDLTIAANEAPGGQSQIR